jgi:hypothetical protein
MTINCPTALHTLKKVDLVGNTYELQTFLEPVIKYMRCNLSVYIPKEPLKNEKYSIGISNPTRVNALLPYIYYDMVLYFQRAQILCSSSIT